MAAIGEIDTDAAATLIVAWRSGRTAHGRVLKAGGDVIGALRGYAKETLQLVGTGQGRSYNPDDEQEDDCPFLSADQDELLDTALLQQLLSGASLPLASPDDLRRRTLALYALLIGNDPAARLIFVRKSNPVSLAAKSIVAIFDQTLTRVTVPILAFDQYFDVVILGRDVWILRQHNFEALFKESEAVLAKTSEWTEALAQFIPMDDSSKEWLATRLRQNSYMRRKVQSILRSPYLQSLSIDHLRRKMKEHSLDPDRFIKDGGLIFSKDTEKEMLQILNEDLWTGDFSGDQYAAAKKARR